VMVEHLARVCANGQDEKDEIVAFKLKKIM
jgi:hypothetical protein